jgi:hypothetical protein
MTGALSLGRKDEALLLDFRCWTCAAIGLWRVRTEVVSVQGALGDGLASFRCESPTTQYLLRGPRPTGNSVLPVGSARSRT